MNTLKTRITTFIISLVDLFKERPELRYLSTDTLRHHLSLCFHLKLSRKGFYLARKRGFLVVHRASSKVNIQAENIFTPLYHALFRKVTYLNKPTSIKRTEHTRTVTVKGKEETVTGCTFYAMKGKRVLYTIPEKYIRTVKGKTATRYIDARGYEKRVSSGPVVNYIRALFNENSIGQRKGVNTRLWFNAVQASDIEQLTALHLWNMVNANHALISKGGKDLERYLVATAKHYFLASLETIATDEEGNPRRTKHKISATNDVEERYVYQRNVPRIYNLVQGDEVTALGTGEYTLIHSTNEGGN